MLERDLAKLRKHIKALEATIFTAAENKEGHVVKLGKKKVILKAMSKDAAHYIVQRWNAVTEDEIKKLSTYMKEMEEKWQQNDLFGVF